MDATPISLRKLAQAWNGFFFAPVDLAVCGIFRIVYATLLLINVLVWWPDLGMWFGEQGALPYAASRTVIDPDSWSLFDLLPKTDAALWTTYGLLIGHTTLLLLGYFTRLQAFGVFVWFTSFQHRNLLLFDGEDYLFRIFAFLLILLPSGRYFALDSRKPTLVTYPIWPLRLIQIQLTLVYVSSAWEKLRSEDWLNGLAVYYVSRLDDVFGRFPVPGIFFESLFLMKLMTWIVLAIECIIPIGLWIKETRRVTILLAIALHLSIDYTMNLFLFQWLMMAGLLVFLEHKDRRDLAEAFANCRRRFLAAPQAKAD